MFAMFLMMFTNQAWDVVFIVYAYTRTKIGGLGMSNAEIGYCLAGAGLCGGFIQIVIFPRLERRFGIPMFPRLQAILILMFAGAPVLNWLVSLYGTDRERGDVVPGTFVGAMTLLLLGRIAAMIFPLSFVMAKRVAPSPAARGFTYGMFNFVAAGARAISPWFVSSLFALTVQGRILGGTLIWAVMSVLTALAVWYEWNIDKAIARAERAREAREAGQDRSM